jgi:hypothetical protein
VTVTNTPVIFKAKLEQLMRISSWPTLIARMARFSNGPILRAKNRLDRTEAGLFRSLLKIQDTIQATLQPITVFMQEERGDVPGWVLVVLMTTGLVTGIWTVAAPRLSSILRSSLDSMNNVR